MTKIVTTDDTGMAATDATGSPDETGRVRPLFGAHPGSVKIGSGSDLTQPVVDPLTDAESGQEVRR